MKRIISLILSLLMAILSSLAPGLFADGGVTGITVGDWLTLVVTEFGMDASEYAEEPYYASVPADNEYFAVVQIAYEGGVIGADDEIDVAAYVTNEFAKKTLINVASTVDLGGLNLAGNKKVANMESAVKALAAAKDLWANKSFGEASADVVADEGVFNLSDVEYIVAGGKLVYAADDFNLAAGATFIAGANEYNLSGAAYKVLAVDKADGLAYVTVADTAIDEAVEAIDFEGSVDVDLTKAQVTDKDGVIIQQAATGVEAAQAAGTSLVDDLIAKGKDLVLEKVGDFIANPKISFSIKGFKVKAGYDGKTLGISVAGNVVDEVRVEKYYALSDISVDAKYDANLAKLKINEAYVIANYDLKETTVLQGSYAGSVVPNGEAVLEDGMSFLDKVKEQLGNLDLVKGGGIKVNIFTFTYPIGTTGLTVDIEVSLSISAMGRIEIIVTSNETKGYEIINNKGRYISDSTIYDRVYNISGDFQVKLGLYISLTFLGFKIVDVAFVGGIGAYVITTIFNVKTNATIGADNVPLDVALDVASGYDNLDELRICANVQLYGILIISVGENSIISKIGLSKTWTIYDRSNGVFAELHIENGGIVDQCTFA